MRYHWSLDVGHLHAHQTTSSCIPDNSTGIDALDDQYTELPDGEDNHAADVDDDMYHELDNPEWSLEDRDVKGWEDVESDTVTADDDNNNYEHDSEDDDRGIYE